MRQISACTIIKNGIKLEYPFLASINSLLPFVDEYIVNCGYSEDSTADVLKVIFKDNKKVKIYENKWEGPEMGTSFFSSQTNYAIEKCSGDWVFYLQSDELIHEQDGEKLNIWLDRADAENAKGITFNYNHFIVDPYHVRKTYSDLWDCYDKELRLFRNDNSLVSFGDAQSFAFITDLIDPRGPQPCLHRPEFFIDSPLNIYHYGWLKSGQKLLEKKKYLKDFYDVTHPDRNEKIPEADGKYIIDPNSVKEWKGTHPKVMIDTLKRNFKGFE